MRVAALGTLLAAVVAGPLLAQAPAAPGAGFDLAGEWMALRQEDQPHRVPGPELGDYTGLPINAASRQKAEAWDASILSQPERNSQPHPVQYSYRGGGGPNIRLAKLFEPVTGQLIGYSMTGLYGRADRRIWLDGRNHPSDYSEHTWDGYSTGVWDGNTLVVTTTHMKYGVIQRNGVPASPYGVLTEYVFRHTEYLTIAEVLDDPIYLEEPFIRTTEWVWDPRQNVVLTQLFEAVDELGNKPIGWVPFWPLGIEHREFGEKFGIPFEATRGGKESLYPEYVDKIRQLATEEAARKAEEARAAARPPAPRR
ncbi:MAG: hypothetical protein A3G76_04960 [Acidobacteria bacterium RIFCSPLOWO2_12_FULL_65_11]|nr:MAG: hypothetical protein A3H95_10620 [Acidobacteria bacterium RIFCSPLOWO2_02_FULL_64_15]OFW31745.1 MAG: hypothetical protein A3G76_04960 [Acidobacteria bacterium RIFCSPLOWO2_12_FULL_65_11]